MEIVRPPNALDYVQRAAVRMTDAVQPGFLIEIYGVGDQGISLPMSNRVAHPQRAESRIMRSAIRVNRMADGVVFKKQDDFARRLHHLHRERMKKDARIAGRSAGMVNRVVRF